ncbi:hypothetical protein RUM44_003295 [Polyplax serrata]|uniref:Long-chain-fatty-acid--CoA ligase n=1 Tax=Polyplax serrata TaxID=468196 RepID=A0ABR1AG32_POLSC
MIGNNHDVMKAEDLERGQIYNEEHPHLNKVVKDRLLSGEQLRKLSTMFLLFGLAGTFAALVWYFMGLKSVIQLILVAAVAFIASGRRYRWFYVALCTAKRDFTALIRFARLIIQNRLYARKNLSVPDIFGENVKKYPNKPAIIFEKKEWSFKDVDNYSNKIANVFNNHGFRKGDTVALLLENRPEFVCIWLGLAKLGIVVPLINYNLKDQSLLHSITVANAKAVIFGSELLDSIKGISSSLPSSVSLYKWRESGINENSNSMYIDLGSLLTEASAEPPTGMEKPNYADKLLYIYTSGTTGLPKAAVITGARFIFLSGAIHYLAGFKTNDRYYTPLPLYHTAGGCVLMGQMIIFGSTVVIRKKFSATSYFADCKTYECTVAQYIGEMCRYILSSPPKAEDKEHKVRLVFGNGLRPQIWKEFVERFDIQQVAEFYGATEGNANIVNIDNTFGAIGFVSRILPAVYPISVIKADPATGEPIRNRKGFCEECGPNEPGVFIGKIIRNDPSREFLGYVDRKASEKKVVRDVFKKGDAAFLSGDIVVADEFGYLYFKDRTGDTFRWKGENVSTTEVEAIISNLIHYKDCIVYGIQMEGHEGRVGMAAIVDETNSLDLNALAEGLKIKLPSYARPYLLRILEKADVTGTYKLRKVDLQKEGFEPKNIKDKLYYLSNGKYEELTQHAYESILKGTIRF